MKNEYNIRVSARTAEALGDAGSGGDGPPWTFSGVAIAAGDILRMDDGTPVLFTRENLRAAAETQADEPLSKDHPRDDDGHPAYPPPTDETVGRVPKAGWLADAGDDGAVGYEATTHDETVASGVQAGSFDVSVHPEFIVGEKDPETGAWIAENIEFRDLSVVSKGHSPNNSAEWGPNQALASFTRESDIGAELAASTESDGSAGETGHESLVSSVVNGTLRGLGFAPGDVDAGAVGLTAGVNTDGQNGNETGGDSGADDPNDTDNTMTDRDQQVTTLVENHGFDPDELDSWDDEQIETTHSTLTDSGDNSDGGGDDTDDTDTTADTDDTTDTTTATSGGGDGETIGDMSVGELGTALRDQGFVTEEDAGDVVASANEQSDREELIATITDATDEHDAEALAEWPTDALEDKASSVTTTARLPGSTGRHTETVTAAHSGSDDDTVGEYGTGVAEH